VLFGAPNGRYLSCICHGDLNSNNVILSDDGAVIFIDFQETGRGHVFEDFVTMEASVRIHHKDGSSVDWTDYLRQEMQMELGGDINGLDEAHRLMAHIRSLALQNFVREERRNYYYAAAAFNFRLLRAPLSEGQLKKCVCAILAALSRL
jgi:aminoglycoside phosphotransferase (APT) family kinase protein